MRQVGEVMDQQGWIKDYRKELDSDIWVMPPLYYKVWQYLKYKVNHQAKEIPMVDGTKEVIERGQHLTSYRSIARGVGYYEGAKYKEPNPKTIKKIIEWLEKNNMLTVSNGKGNRQYTKITIVNYSIYQSGEDEGVTVKAQQSNSKVTPSTHKGNSEETLGKQSVDINKNDKELYKNDKNEEEGKEGKEKPPSLSPLSFPTPYHETIFNQWSENTYRTWFMNTEIEDRENEIVMLVQTEFVKNIINEKFKKYLDILLGKKVVVRLKGEQYG